MTQKKTLILLIFSLFLSTISLATTWHTITYGYWNNVSVWSTGIAPSYTISDTIIINHPIILDQNLTLNNGGHLKIQSTGGLCGHQNVTVFPNASILKYGILELDSLLIPGGQVIFNNPGEVILTLYGIISNGGSLSSNGCALSVGPWFECRRSSFDFALNLEEMTSNLFEIYPNPIKDQLLINTSKSNEILTISIIDELSKVVHYEKILADKQLTIDLNNISNGIYFLTITNDNFSKTEKIIKN